ncbi:MAG: peptidoglycan DD-metalloendopeptidase family protein [Bacteroidales bacterium]|nr:peptidoglycan DD-metalloendopeptidase family protein [Bacteroidales bacterium]
MRKLLLLTVLVLLATAASGQDVSKQNERKRQIEEEISFIDNQLKSIAGKQKATTEQLSLIQKRVTNRQSIIHDLDRKIAVVNDEMTNKQREINRLQKELDTLKIYYEKLIYNTYKNRDTRVWFMYLLSSQNIGQGYRRFSYLKSLAGEVNAQADKMRTKQEELQAEREKLAMIKAEAQVAKAEREEEYRKLVAEQKQSQEDMKRLARSEKQYRNELAAKRKEIARLDQEIRSILKATVSGKNKKATDQTKVDAALSGQFAQNKGKLPWPLKQGVITERFGVHNHPVYKNLKLPDNPGVTFSTVKGADVFCVFDGEVSRVFVMPGYNQCVIVQHGEYFTLYCKLAKVNVKSGQKVKTGDKLGTLETEGNTSSLHFQLWKGTDKQDPEKWLRK